MRYDSVIAAQHERELEMKVFGLFILAFAFIGISRFLGFRTESETFGLIMACSSYVLLVK